VNKIDNLRRVEVVPIERSLGTLKDAHFRLEILKNTPASPTVLASQIHICDLILQEIVDIRKRLAANRYYAHLPPHTEANKSRRVN
jgi:hypothetical protein